MSTKLSPERIAIRIARATIKDLLRRGLMHPSASRDDNVRGTAEYIIMSNVLSRLCGDKEGGE